jgi:hypothetical protein
LPDAPSTTKTVTRPALPGGPYWTVEQVISSILHRNEGSSRMYEVASVFEPENLVPDVFAVIGTYRTPQQTIYQEKRARKVFEAFQILRQMFGTGVVRSIKNGRVLPPSYWRVDPTQQVVEGFTAANDGFRKLLAQTEVDTQDVLIPVVDVQKAFLVQSPATPDKEEAAPTEPDRLEELPPKLTDKALVRFLRGQTGAAKNKKVAYLAAKDHFRRHIPLKPFDAARVKAKFAGKRGRPPKPKK